MEYRKLEVGTKLKFVGDPNDYDHAQKDDVLELLVDDETSLPYRCRNERNDGEDWYYASDVELADTPQATTLFRKVVTLTTDDDIEFTYDGSGVLIAHSETGAVTVALATLIAAVEELRKHAS